MPTFACVGGTSQGEPLQEIAAPSYHFFYRAKPPTPLFEFRCCKMRLKLIFIYISKGKLLCSCRRRGGACCFSSAFSVFVFMLLVVVVAVAGLQLRQTCEYEPSIFHYGLLSIYNIDLVIQGEVGNRWWYEEQTTRGIDVLYSLHRRRDK